MQFNENENEPITTPDTENRTKFHADDGDDLLLDKNGKYKWKRLENINKGAADSFGNRVESLTRKQERAVAFDIVSDRLALTDFHKREGRELIMDEIDTQTLSRPNSNIHLICFCLSAILVNRDIRGRNYHPMRKNNDDLFLEMIQEEEYDPDMINSLMQKIEDMI